MQSADSPLLFDSAFLARLERLSLLAKKLSRGEAHAERRSRQTGSSLEFADFREYTAGDDPRTIDWNVYGRLDRLFVKLFEHEQDVPIDLLIDASASMRWEPWSIERGARSVGRPADSASRMLPAARSTIPRPTKLAHAQRIAASLAYVALAHLDRVNVHWFGGDLAGELGGARGKGEFHRVLNFLRRPPLIEGPTRLLPSLRSFGQRARRHGVAIVMSDFFDPDGYAEALARLQHGQFEVHAIQVLDPAELDPPQGGELRLLEGETGAALEIAATDALLRGYRAEVEAFLHGLQRFCRERGIGYAQASTAVEFDDLVLRVLRGGMLLR